jgi:hypothetical protein
VRKKLFRLSNLLLATVAVPTVLFGAVESWALALTGILTAIAFVSFVWRVESLTLRDAMPLFFCAAALVAYIVFQLIPLPLSLIGWLHSSFTQFIALPPGTASESIDLAIQVPAAHSISIYPFATEMELSRSPCV